jgi:anti-sigma B factor antagonist
MNIEQKKQGNVDIVCPEGRLDSMNSISFDKHLSKLIDEGSVLIALDCAKLDYVSSAGLRAILSAAKKAKQAKGKLTLGNPSQQVSEILDIAGFSSILPIFKTIEEAVNACTA